MAGVPVPYNRETIVVGASPSKGEAVNHLSCVCIDLAWINHPALGDTSRLVYNNTSLIVDIKSEK